MKWKCDICDTYNDESSRQCFICGHARSAESIREGRIRAREEKIARISAVIYENIYRVLKLLFFIGLSASLIGIVVTIIIKRADGSLNELRQIAEIIAEHTWLNIIKAFDRNLMQMLSRAAHTLGSSFPSGAKAILSVASGNSSGFLQAAFLALTDIAKVNLQSSYNNIIVPLVNKVSLNISALGKAATGLISNAGDSVSVLSGVVTGALQKIIKHFN